MFFVLYFLMTGGGTSHMFEAKASYRDADPQRRRFLFRRGTHTPVELTGLYWHFVDIVWVFLFALFYIEGLHLHKL